MRTTVKPPGGWETAEDKRLLFCVRQKWTVGDTAKDLNRLEQSVKVRAIILKSPFPEAVK